MLSDLNLRLLALDVQVRDYVRHEELQEFYPDAAAHARAVESDIFASLRPLPEQVASRKDRMAAGKLVARL